MGMLLAVVIVVFVVVVALVAGVWFRRTYLPSMLRHLPTVVTALPPLPVRAVGRVCVVTGAKGFVGRHLVERLLEEEKFLAVVCCDAPAPDYIHPRTVCVTLDVGDREQVLRVFEEYRPAVVFHLSILRDGRSSWIHSHRLWRANAGGTAAVLE
eukprot:CAMPEP_0119152066 /NCGR_PEP_ID=MMETSP1310-20130426/47216_1 /TAXON_ID=464262 /ORGANISM="Genus nov. species nov., Strain RCC2339" /LENGTH=153 /DNA_ID=CAMNT_0007144399 /DNA_START=101 /DNA_END=559 /DNA_ORIENTATION=+